MSAKRPRGLKRQLWAAAVRVEAARCAWCPKLLDYRAATVDHEPALAEGGTPGGAVLACDDCNQRRGREVNSRILARRRGSST